MNEPARLMNNGGVVSAETGKTLKYNSNINRSSVSKSNCQRGVFA